MKRINLAITHFTESLAALLLALIVGINALSVFYRYVLSSPIGWSEEILRYFIIWAVYLVMGATIVRGEQMAINLLDMIELSWVRKFSQITSVIAICVLAAIILWFGLPLVIANSQQYSPTMRIPMSIPYSAVIAGYLLVAVQSLLLLLSDSEVQPAEE